MEKQSYYAILSAEVRYADIPDKAKLLYAEITALCNKEGYCWANNKFFADLYKITITRVSDLISILKKEGFITCETGKDNLRKIYLTLEENNKGGRRKVQGVLKKSSTPSIYNNASNNKSNNTEQSSASETPSETLTSEQKQINEIIHFFEAINPACKNLYERKVEREACLSLLKTYSYEKVKQVIEDLLPETNGMEYFPTITTPLQLWQKWASLGTAIKKKQSEKLTKDEVKYNYI